MIVELRNFTIIDVNSIINYSFTDYLKYYTENCLQTLLSSEVKRLHIHFFFKRILDIFRNIENKNFIFYFTEETDNNQSWIYSKLIKLLKKFGFITLESQVQYNQFITLLKDNDSPEFDEIAHGYFNYISSLTKLNQYLKQGSFIQLVKACKGLEMLKLIITTPK